MRENESHQGMSMQYDHYLNLDIYAIAIYNDRQQYIYVCVFMFIYSFPQKEYFVVSQLFRVARHVRCSKQRSKPTQRYTRLMTYP